jgi:16S rRNA (guanine966-N2)-methyltransferase
MLRVISGKYKSRQLVQPTPEITRPTTDRAKEAIFSMLQHNLKNKIVLDLFAGSGSLGIEAISQGAMKAIFVDNNRAAINVINENVNNLEITNCEINAMSALDYLKRRTGSQYDIVFLDPPFSDVESYNLTINYIAKNNMLKTNGLIIVEIDDVKKLKLPSNLTFQKNKQYGKSHIIFIGLF